MKKDRENKIRKGTIKLDSEEKQKMRFGPKQ